MMMMILQIKKWLISHTFYDEYLSIDSTIYILCRVSFSVVILLLIESDVYIFTR
jgi:hypothetical protein